MIAFDFESGQVFVARTALALRMADDGCLHINPPHGPVLKPLTVLERLRILHYAMAQHASIEHCKRSLAAALLQQATVQAGEDEGDDDPYQTSYQAIALHMAGAAITAPAIPQCIQLIATTMGWSPDSIWTCEAAQLDQLAASLQPRQSSGWNQLLFNQNPQDEVAAYVDILAGNLLRRMSNDDLAEADDMLAASSVSTSPVRHSEQTLQRSDQPGSAQSESLTNTGSESMNSGQPMPPNHQHSLQPPGFNPTTPTGEAGNAIRMSAPDNYSRSDEKSPANPVVKKPGSDEALSTHTPDNAELAHGMPQRQPQAVDKTTRSDDRQHVGRGERFINNIRSPLPKTGSGNVLPLTLRRTTQYSESVKTPVTGVPAEQRPATPSFSGVSAVGAFAPLPQTHSAALKEHELAQSITSFFENSGSASADELAEILNREADLRGI